VSNTRPSDDLETTVRVRLFGPLSVTIGDRSLGPRDFGGVKPKQLLEILLIGRGSPVPKDRVADLLWGDELPQNVSASIETYVSVLRRSLDPEGDVGRQLVRTEREAYAVDLSRIDLDLEEVNRSLDNADSSSGIERRRHLERALGLTEEELLADEPYAEWAIRLRDHYEVRLGEAAVEAAGAAAAASEWRAAHRFAERAIEVDSWNEPAYRLSMLALAGWGRRHEALRVFERLEVALEELGVEPDQLTMELVEKIRDGTDTDALSRELLAGHRAGPAESKAPGREMRVLLVEDNPADVRLVEESLRGSRHTIHVDVASDGEEALEMLRRQGLRPDLVLLDLQLPKMDGTEVLAAVKSDPDLRRIPVVMLTTSAAEQDVLRCYDLGANGYMTKPADLDEFAHLVRAIEAFWPATAKVPSRE
jgi:DNA-binding response OmpR family regulator